jgi:alkylated DNA repair dioxygenase AlkB
MSQAHLFAIELPPHAPSGLRYQDDFISSQQERELLHVIATLPFRNSQYRQYTARRRTVNYGAGYDFQHLAATPAPPIPEFLSGIRARAAAWIGVEPQAFVQALISEYQPGTPLGWHRDVPEYETVVGISLLAPCRIRFRRYPWNAAEKSDIFALEPQPRSAYVLSGDARWKWQHSAGGENAALFDYVADAEQEMRAAKKRLRHIRWKARITQPHPFAHFAYSGSLRPS